MKRYVIDGHNLVPNVEGLSLSDPDDENKLIDRMQAFCNRARCHVELFFDQAPHGVALKSSHALVHVNWVRTGRLADDAIIAYVSRQGKNARNLIVVSSDHRVQNEVRALGAQVLSSEAFAYEMHNNSYNRPSGAPGGETNPSPDEIEEWLQLFSKKKK
jgi:uncharacterized protein